MKISWLGQAGFRLVTDNGTVIMIDPYLSDTLRYKKGESYRREVPMRDELLDSHVDVVILTHIHDDHTDFGTLDRLLAANGPVALLAPVNVLAALRARYARAENYMLFDPGIEITLNGIRFSSTYAAHSDEHPIGVVIEGDGKVVCHTGDTMFHKRLPSEYPQGADLLMLPINGSGYNMNAVDAARLTAILAPKAVLPMHWDMFKAYGCNVNEFISEFRDGGQRILVPEHYAEFEV